MELVAGSAKPVAFAAHASAAAENNFAKSHFVFIGKNFFGAGKQIFQIHFFRTSQVLMTCVSAT
jgi:hypothetical protein